MTAGRVSVGLVGYGPGGATFHAPYIAAVPRLSLDAVVTRQAERVARDHPAARVVATPEALFTDPAIGLVVVSTPNATHFDLARKALGAGKHVVVDKPFTATAAEAHELGRLAKARGLVVAPFHNRRFDGDFMTVRATVEAGLVGRPLYYECRHDLWRPDAPGDVHALWDKGPHLIDQCLVLFGMPETVAATFRAERAHAREPDFFHVVLGYRGLAAVLTSSLAVADSPAHYIVHGSGGSFVKRGFDPQADSVRAGRRPGTPGWGEDAESRYGLLTGTDGVRRAIPTVPGNYCAYYEAIAGAILDNTPPPVNAGAGRNVAAVIDACLASAASGRRRITIGTT